MAKIDDSDRDFYVDLGRRETHKISCKIETKISTMRPFGLRAFCTKP